jgi:hypothetical protein
MDYSTCLSAIMILYMLGSSLMYVVVSALNDVKNIDSFVFFLVILIWPIIVMVVLIKNSFRFLKS